jgi:hypothetical protein
MKAILLQRDSFEFLNLVLRISDVEAKPSIIVNAFAPDLATSSVDVMDRPLVNQGP